MIQKRRRLRRAAPLSKRHDPHHPDPRPLRKGKHIARRHPMPGLAAPLAVDPAMAGGDQKGGEVAAPEEPRLKQPFVEPQARCGGRVGTGSGSGQSLPPG